MIMLRKPVNIYAALEGYDPEGQDEDDEHGEEE